MKNTWFSLLLAALTLLFPACHQAPRNFLDEDPALKEARMAWWEEARFGMFIHWGLYAIPAGEWNGATNHAEWIRTTARIPLETYDGFVNEFNPVNYDPDSWVKLAKRAGMKYIVITSKHHDGFCLFDSKLTDFDVMSTPYGKDLLGPLADACREQELRISWYHSIMDWHHPDYLPRRGWETGRPAEGADFDRYVDYMKGQLDELVTNYGDIGVLWFDGEWEDTWTHERGRDLYNYVRNLQPDIIINNRVDVGRAGMAGMTRPGEYAGDFGTPEQEIPPTGRPGVYWETCMTMNNHWGYNKADENWKTPGELIRKLADIASKGGNFLLNVGPKADGSFPDQSISILNAMGDWMERNGEAIYGTSASPFRRLTFGRCTRKNIGDDTRLYLHVFDWPDDGILRVPGIYNKPVKARLLADKSGKELEFYRFEDAIHIQLPQHAPDPINTVVALDIEGIADITNPPVIEIENDIFIDVLSVDISSDQEDLVIRYTLDGQVPDSRSPRVEGPMQIENTASLVVRGFRDGKPVTDTSAHVFRKVAPMSPVKAINPTQGLLKYYYEGNWENVPDFATLVPEKQWTDSAFNLTGKVRDDFFGFRFEGLIEIAETGVYTFYTESDDGSMLYINDSLVVDNDGLHSLQEGRGTIPLTRGLHTIRVDYFEKTGNDFLKVLYRGPGFLRRPIPKIRLFHTK